MSRLLRELRDAARSLIHRPGFATAAILTLALGIGANTAIFSAVDALLVKPMPFPRADRLVRIESVRGGQSGSISYRETRDLAELTTVFADVAAYTDQGQYNASGFGKPEELVSTITTHNLFRVLGIPLLVGQPWPELLDRTRDFKVVISYGLWQRRFGGRRDVLGQTMTLDGAEGYTVVGVLPKGFGFPVRADLYRSHGITAAASAYEDRSRRGRWGIARLAEGVSLERAQGQADALARRLEREFSATNTGVGFRLSPLRSMYVGEVRPFLLLLLGAVSLVLLIACCNVTNLLLSRVVGRGREIAVRTALGASRADVIRILVAESVVIALVAGVVGVTLGAVGIWLINRLVRLDMPAWLAVGLSWRVLLATAVLSTGAGILTGLVPALRAGKGDLAATLKEGGRTGSEGHRHRTLRRVLVVAEMALAVVLLIGAGLMVRSFRAISRLDPGFSPDSVLAFRVELGWRAYGTLAATARFQRELLAWLGELPGVRTAAMTSNLPLDGRPKVDIPISLEGQDAEARRANPFINYHVVSPGLFETLAIPILRGRGLSPLDRDSAPPAALVSQATARRLWPDRDPLGARFQLGSEFRVVNRDTVSAPWWTVVGVVGDVRHEALTAEPALDVYLPFEQEQTGSNYFLLKTSGAPGLLADPATRLVESLDANQSWFDARPVASRIADRVWVPRLAGALFSAFGALAATLAAIGVFAVLAYTVAQRTRELGVRQALGASPGSLARLVLKEGLLISLIGCLIGLGGALLGGRLLRGLLHGVSPFDPVTLITVPGLLLLVAGTACWIPARRGARVAPIEALRSE